MDSLIKNYRKGNGKKTIPKPDNIITNGSHKPNFQKATTQFENTFRSQTNIRMEQISISTS